MTRKLLLKIGKKKSMSIENNNLDHVCSCEKWRKNEFRIRGIHIFGFVTPFKCYDAVERFKFCPYCAKELVKE